MGEFEKCDKGGCCKHLSKRLVDRGVGFRSVYTVKLVGNASARFRGVVYKMSTKDAGLMLNLCPFCGGKPGDFNRDQGVSADDAHEETAS